ncbi:3'-5' exonuclease [Acinetobacter nosocomialis]|uniref:3'-5' exonuclease n=1 Tax=Acinetobacter nosocomialis TaxID=106654 RepID=UPI00112285B5|nr:nuclease-related domain-containing DEAD/DEAH box helicase [Acinetobacter nosocomialis]MDE1701518.1 3'-5' exonuclease [Acinetobacter nosocomialis]HDG7212542.1 AAA family ATPase [Acinetobacter nosocomialis]
MVDMVPTTLNNVDNTTLGERKVYKFLQDLFADQDAIVWYETEALGRYSDFILWLPTHGLLAIEVKDWSKSNFKEVNPTHFTGTFYRKDKAHTVPNPRAQVRTVAMNLRNKCKMNDSLIAKSGFYEGNPLFPITHSVFYTNIYRSDAAALGLLEEGINEQNKILFKDELEYDLENKDSRKELIRKIHLHFKEFFYFEPLTYTQVKTLRYLLFPEIRINTFENDELFDAQPQELMTLDIQQEMIAKNIGAGHRILKGVAGSGKSLVIACRAKYLNSVYPDWKVLVVCFNNTLCNHIQNMMSENDVKNLEISTFHGLVKKITNANLRKLDDESPDQYNLRVAEILNSYVESTNFLDKYDAILIDEGQDFAQEWIQSLVKILNPETNSILFCYDPAQNIFNRKRPSWKSFGLEVQGKKPTELMRCYRNTKEILVTARSFLNSKKLDSLVAEDDFDRVLDPDTGECKVGIFPVTYQSQNYQETINLIVKKIKYLVNNGHPENSIAILIARHESQEKLDALLKKAFEEHASNIAYKFIITSHDKKALNLKELNIKILNFESSKGLEFDHVFLIGLENMPRITAKLVRDEDTERKLTYVAMTRAKENLYMISHKNTGYFSEIAEIINSLKPATEIIIKKNKEVEIPNGTNAYQAWTEDEEVRLIDSFMEEGKSVQEISKILERSSGAIRARLKKLKLLE